MAQSSKTPQPVSSPVSGGMTLARMAAQSQLDFELNFFGTILERHPTYLDTLRHHARNLWTAKRFHECLQMDRRIVQLTPTDGVAFYRLACDYAVLKQPEQALHALRRAVELGYREFDVMRKNRDLEAIRKDPRFRQLVREYDR